jgi:hypothetical protein
MYAPLRKSSNHSVTNAAVIVSNSACFTAKYDYTFGE